MSKISVFKRFFIFIISFIFVQLTQSCSCKRNNKENVPPFVTINLKVRTVEGVIIKEGNVHIFNSYDSYLNSINSGDFSSSFKSKGIKNGQVVFDSLPSGKKYWFYSSNINTVLFPGYSILYDNSMSSFELPFESQSSSVINGTILLKPIEGLVVFWTKDGSNSPKLPIKINLDKIQIGTVNSSLSSQPLYTNKSALTVKKKNGQFNYYGKGERYCVWTNAVDVKPGIVNFVELEQCSSGGISFYSSNQPKENYPISIQISYGELKDTINSNGSNPDCFTDNNTVSNFVLPPGKYTYFAKSLSRKCAWSGEFFIEDNNCKSINFEICR